MASAAASEAEETTRLRKPRFSFEENQILIREVRAHYPQLYGAQSRRVSVAERRRVWDGIAAKINGITSWKRTGQEVQKRWNDFKRRTKEKLARVPHSTQSAGPTADEAFSAEEETIFAILGPGVAGPGAGSGTEPPPPAAASSQAPAPSACAPRSTCSEDRRAERRADTSAHTKGDSRSPDPWARPTARPQEGVCVPVKERETPPPAPSQGPAAAPPAPSPPPSSAAPPGPDPALDLLRAQQETADAIRELAGTLRQGLAKLSEALSALLPLLPGAPSDPPPLPRSPPPPPPPRPAPPTPVPKVEMIPEPVSVVAAVMDGAVVATRGVIVSPRIEEGGARPPLAPLPPPDSPPHKRRKGFPARKRRGRWKAP